MDAVEIGRDVRGMAEDDYGGYFNDLDPLLRASDILIDTASILGGGAEGAPLFPGSRPVSPQGVTGPVAVPGLMGVTGPIVVPGLTGATGPIAVPGLTGATGPIAIPGLTGVTGPVAVPGLTGATGPLSFGARLVRALTPSPQTHLTPYSRRLPRPPPPIPPVALLSAAGPTGPAAPPLPAAWAPALNASHIAKCASAPIVTSDCVDVAFMQDISSALHYIANHELTDTDPRMIKYIADVSAGGINIRNKYPDRSILVKKGDEILSMPITNPIRAKQYRYDMPTVSFANPVAGPPGATDQAMFAQNTDLLEAIAPPEIIADKRFATAILESLWECSSKNDLNNNPRCFPLRVLGEKRLFDKYKDQATREEAAAAILKKTDMNMILRIARFVAGAGASVMMGITGSAPIGMTGATGAVQLGVTGAAPLGATGAVQAGVTGVAPLGTTGAVQAGVTGAAPLGATGAVQLGVTGAAPLGATGTVQAGVTGAVQAGVTGPRVTTRKAHTTRGIRGSAELVTRLGAPDPGIVHSILPAPYRFGAPRT